MDKCAAGVSGPTPINYHQSSDTALSPTSLRKVISSRQRLSSNLSGIARGTLISDDLQSTNGISHQKPCIDAGIPKNIGPMSRTQLPGR